MICRGAAKACLGADREFLCREHFSEVLGDKLTDSKVLRTEVRELSAGDPMAIPQGTPFFRNFAQNGFDGPRSETNLFIIWMSKFEKQNSFEALFKDLLQHLSICAFVFAFGHRS